MRTAEHEQVWSEMIHPEVKSSHYPLLAVFMGVGKESTPAFLSFAAAHAGNEHVPQQTCQC